MVKVLGNLASELQVRIQLQYVLLKCMQYVHTYNNIKLPLFKYLKTKYRTVKNFGGEETLANHHNLPSIFANIPNEARGPSSGNAVCVVNV